MVYIRTLVVILQSMRHLILLTCFSVSLMICYGQKLNKVYYGVSSDSLHHGHELEFVNDTTLEIRTFPRHMSQQFKLIFNYRRINNTLELYKKDISTRDSIALINNKFSQYCDHTVLIIDGKALTDESNGIVFVLYKDFKKKYDLIYLVDGEIYKQETGLPDSYGLINIKSKENKALKKRMTSIKNDLNNYDLKIYRGLEAYKKFGYESVFGVIELKRRM